MNTFLSLLILTGISCLLAGLARDKRRQVNRRRPLLQAYRDTMASPQWRKQDDCRRD